MRHELGEQTEAVARKAHTTITDYEALILAPQEAFAVLMQLKESERTLTLLAASTGLRISECLGLQMAGCQLLRVDHQLASYLDLWLGRSTEEQGFTRACAASPVAG